MKLDLKVDWKSWDKVVSKLDNLQFKEHLLVEAKELTAIGLFNLQRFTPRMKPTPLTGPITKHLADAWTYDIEGDNPIYIQIYNAVKEKWPVIKFLEFGTRPHLIPHQPKPPGTWLRFFWRNQEIFAKQVSHQGSRAFRMVDITRTDLINRIEYLKRELPRELVKSFMEG